MPINVKEIHLHNIDKDNSIIEEKQVNITDAKDYITDLTTTLINNQKMRCYIQKSDFNPVIEQIKKLIASHFHHESLDESAATLEPRNNKTYVDDISTRLLDAQLNSMKKYVNFNHINKCSLIQSLVEMDSELIYIFALVDHNEFIDTTDLIKKIGLPNSDKATYKSARIHFNEDLSINKIYLCDSNTKISEYWYDGFLDLKPIKDDAFNTEHAFKFINNMLRNKIFKQSPTDYNEYTNNLKSYFKHTKNFDIDECLDFTFTDPIDNNLDINSIKLEIKNTNTIKNNFDPSFPIDTKDIDKSLRNIKYKLNKKLELKIYNPDDTIKDNVITKKLDDGEIILALKNVDRKELLKFNFDNINL